MAERLAKVAILSFVVVFSAVELIACIDTDDDSRRSSNEEACAHLETLAGRFSDGVATREDLPVGLAAIGEVADGEVKAAVLAMLSGLALNDQEAYAIAAIEAQQACNDL